MSVRIYALAKELKIDSKELVEICPKAGISGKGSALASLDDDEVVKIKAYVSGGGANGAGAPAKAIPRAPSPRAPSPGAPNTAPPSKKPISTKPDEGVPGVLRREDYIAPGGVSGKPRIISAKQNEPPAESKKKPPTSDGPPKSTPSVKLAPMPTASTPPPVRRSTEPAPQKPDIKLPADAIRAGKSGAKPLQAHLRKHEARRKTEEKKPSTPPPKQPADSALGTGRDRRRGGAKTTTGTEGGDGKSKGANVGGREQRQLRRTRGSSGRRGGNFDYRPRRSYRPKRTGTNTAAPRKGKVVVELPATVRSFSESLGVSVRDVLGKLLGFGKMSNINAEVDHETAELLCVELGVEVDFKSAVDLEDQLFADFNDFEDPEDSLVPRAPVVTFLGHVDHGKTSLLDRIINIDVVSGESGGITQHIRAYRIEKDGRPIAFVDTPGHEAFTEMRARGANVTDIAVLVIAADDGVMPQTEEAISHARAADVPIVVALNKMDLPGVNIDRIFQQLAENDLLPTEWGGDTEVIKCSATTGDGVDDLLETIVTLAELHDYKANPERPAAGTCIEAELHEGRGVVAKLLVQKGTLKVGDILVCGEAHGRVKAMYDTLLGEQVTHETAEPSTPVNVTGLNVAPGAGEHFYVMDDITKAREIASDRASITKRQSLSGTKAHVTLENLFEHLGEEEVQTLNLILRADVKGSIEAILKELTKLDHPEVQVKVLQATVGGITEADIQLADASDAVVIGFNVVPDEGARVLAREKGVQVRRYDIIYKVTSDIKSSLEGMLKPELRESDLGRALVLRLFPISRVGTVAGCRVLSGTIQRDCRMRVTRENRILGVYPLDSLRRDKDDSREVREGFECGIKLVGFNDLKEGDVLEAYKIEEVARSF